MKKIKLLFFPIVFLFLTSCLEPYSCDTVAASFRDNYECNLLVQKIQDGSPYTYFYGIDLTSHKQTQVADGSKHIRDYLEMFAVGDSVIKKKGNYTITIKRKGKVILIPYKCNDKEYLDKS